MSEKVKLICLTPVKNEAWILDDFLASASLWADHIIIADQMSKDGSREIAKKYEKVILVDNMSTEFNEPERQKLLIGEARKISGSKILIALDADEFVAGSCIGNGELEKLKNLKKGTVINFSWPFISSGFKYYWRGDSKEMPFGFVDDGSPHLGKKIHSNRIPVPNNGNEVFSSGIEIMHFQFTDWKRMESKHHWYQCYERKNFPKKSIVKIFRLYSHMYRVGNNEKQDLGNEWFNIYNANGIDLKKNRSQDKYYWDDLTLKMFNENPELYKNIDLPWNNTLILKYLRATRSMDSLLIKVLDRVLGCIF